MSEVGVEAAYRRWLRWYPREFRREHADELLGVLLAETGPDCRGPRPVECLDLVRGGLSMRLRPRMPRSDRAGFAVVRLMYLVAVVEPPVAPGNEPGMRWATRAKQAAVHRSGDARAISGDRRKRSIEAGSLHLGNRMPMS